MYYCLLLFKGAIHTLLILASLRKENTKCPDYLNSGRRDFFFFSEYCSRLPVKVFLYQPYFLLFTSHLEIFLYFPALLQAVLTYLAWFFRDPGWNFVVYLRLQNLREDRQWVIGTWGWNGKGRRRISLSSLSPTQAFWCSKENMRLTIPWQVIVLEFLHLYSGNTIAIQWKILLN